MVSDFSHWLRVLEECRVRCLRCLLCFLVLFFICFYWRNRLYLWCAEPILHVLHHPEEALVSTTLFSPVWVPMKTAMAVAFLATVPCILYQIWAFFMPALYRTERIFLSVLMILSVVLFFLGAAAGLCIVLPWLCTMMHAAMPDGLRMFLDMNHYLGTVMQMMFGFGVIAEVPVIIMALLGTGVCTVAQCSQWRRYWIVLSFVIAAVIAPPDVLSQCVFAIPLCVLYELGLFLYRIYAYMRRTMACRLRH